MTLQRFRSNAVEGSNGPIFDHLLEGCQVIDPEWRYLYVNDACVAQARRSREELIGKTMLECYPGIETTAMFASLRQCMAERRPVQLENEFTFPNGARIVYDLRMVPIAEGVCIFSADVTERHQPLSAIVVGSGDAIIARSLDGIITSWNRGAEQIFGYTADEMVGQNFSRVLPAGSSVESQAMTQRLLAGEVVQHQGSRRHKDGRALDIWATISPVRGSDGNITGISAIMRDVSELNRAQRELAQTRDGLEAVNRELSAFSYSVAHDLRTPLVGILGFSQILSEDYGPRLDAEGRDHLEQILLAAGRMDGLIEAMLRLGRVTRATIRREHLDLSTLAEATRARLARTDPNRRPEVKIMPNMRANGDAVLIAALLDNLIGNAWKFTRARIPGRIEIGRAHSADGGAYFVRDDGIGFDMSDASRLFGAFQRLHTEREFEGTGIGLATVQRIVERHGGRVWAEAKRDEGATFFFTLGAPEDAG